MYNLVIYNLLKSYEVFYYLIITIFYKLYLYSFTSLLIVGPSAITLSEIRNIALHQINYEV